MQRIVSIFLAVILPASASAQTEVTAYLKDSTATATNVLKKFTFDDLKRLKSQSSREKDPVTGRVVKWKGVLLGDVVTSALADLPAERRAQVDLVILRNDAGSQALIPRAFLQKYPILLAWQKESTDLGGYQSVIPWTSKAKKFDQEGAPLESFFVAGVSRIEVANYREQYGLFFLQRRTDPAAVRGEKLFVQSCVTCHSAGQGPSLSPAMLHAALDPGKHPGVKGNPKFNERDGRALLSYLEAFRRQSPAASNGTPDVSASRGPGSIASKP